MLEKNLTLHNSLVEEEILDSSRVSVSLEWQSPTYLIEKLDTSLSEYSCDSEQADCKINPKITPLLDNISSSQLTCNISASFELIPTTDPCNPNTSLVPEGEHTLVIQIVQVPDNTLLLEKIIAIHHTPPEPEAINPEQIGLEVEWQTPTYLLEKADTKIFEYSCDPAQTECKINPKFTPLLDGISSTSLTCDIAADFDLIPTTDPCNPNTSIVPEGEHRIEIHVTSAN